MNNENFSNHIITVFPHNKNSFKYKINDGSFHILRKDKVFPFVKDLCKDSQIREIKRLLHWIRPFIIIEGEAFELSMEETEKITSKKVLETVDVNTLKREKSTEKISNDKLKKSVEDRVMKIDY